MSDSEANPGRGQPAQMKRPTEVHDLVGVMIERRMKKAAPLR